MARKPRVKTLNNTIFIPKKFKALTKNQEHYIRMIETNTITIVEGPSGTGKGYCAIGVAVQMLKADRIEKIVITRPLVECDESLGHLPGEIFAKTAPFLLPIYDSLKHFVSLQEIQQWEENGVLEICPLALMRGRTFSRCIVIADELQNGTFGQIKMLLTRIGEGCRMIITGDSTQTDLQSQHAGALRKVMNKLKDTDDIAIVHLDTEDIVRHGLISVILEKLE